MKKLFNYKSFLESKSVTFVEDNKDKLSEEEISLIADIINHFEGEATVNGENGWEEVEGYVKCVKDDEIHIGVKFDFNHLDGEVNRNSTVIIINRKDGSWYQDPSITD